MNILLRPTFLYYVDDEEYLGVNEMKESNQDMLDGELLAYFKEIFPECDLKRVPKTNYYLAKLLDEPVDDIRVWYMTHLDKAIANGFIEDRDWLIEPDVDDGESVETDEMFIDTTEMSTVPTNIDIDTQRDEAMGFIRSANNLDSVDIPDLFAKKTDYTGLSFYRSNLNRSVFTEAILPMTIFQNAVLTGANFQGADLRYASFEGANLTGANFQDAQLKGAKFDGSNWQEAINLADNPSFVKPPVDIAIPSVLKKLIKTQQKGKMLKDDIYQDENSHNAIDPKNSKKMNFCKDGWQKGKLLNEADEQSVVDAKNPDKFRHCDVELVSRTRMIATKAQYEILPAEYGDVDPTLVSIENEETDKGKKLGEDLILDEDEDEDEKEPLKKFFLEQPDGLLFRVVQGEKFDDILVSNTIYHPTTTDYLRNETDLILYTCEPGRMGTAKRERPLIDIGKAIGMSTARIYVDFSEFKRIVLADTRTYKCYILYNTRESEQYKTLTSHKVLNNPGMNVVGELHCNDGDGMSGAIWSIKRIGDNLIEGGRRNKKKERKRNMTKKKKHIKTNKKGKKGKKRTIKKIKKSKTKKRK
jgi:hypothetical protein